MTTSEEERKKRSQGASRRYSQKNPKYGAEKTRRYREANPEKAASTARKCAKAYYHANKGDPAFKQSLKERTSDWFQKRYQNGGWATYKVAHCRRANSRLGLEASDVTKASLLMLFETQGGRCHYTGVPFKMQAGIFAPSLDRKDVNRGYFLDNIVLCLAGVNYAKSDSSLDEFYEFLRALKGSNVNENL